MKIFVICASIFTVLYLSSASSIPLLNDRQFSLKSLSENTPQGQLYQPLKIHTKVIEEFFNDDEIFNPLASALVASTKIISDLLLTKPSTDKLRLGENNQCADILLSQIIQREEIDADIAIFAVNNKEKGEIITSKKCEVNENKFIKAIALEINAEEFIKLEEILKVKELCIAIANVLYGEEEEEKQALIKEICEYLDKKTMIDKIENLGACQDGIGNCITCANTTHCKTCASGYFVKGGICIACTPPCAQCTGAATYCTSCYDPHNMRSWPGVCACYDPDASFNPQSLTCECNPGYYSNNGTCTGCYFPCSNCTNSTFCTGCMDPVHMTLSPATGTCTCTDPNAFINITTWKCQCNKGYYSNGGICAACTPPCSSCSNSSTFCTSCDDPGNMGLWPSAGTCSCRDPSATFNTESLTCECNAGYFWYFSRCQLCQPPCSTCATNIGCATCYDPTHMTINNGQCTCNDPNTLFSYYTLTCQCKSGMFPSDGKCLYCDEPCSECLDTPTFCTECEDIYRMKLDKVKGICTCKDPNASFDNSSLRCQCNEGYLNVTVCTPCEAPCATCTGILKYCTSCDDAAHMKLTDGICRCIDPNANFSDESNTCQCNPGYFSLSEVCTKCDPICSTCLGLADFCTSCEDSAHMTLNLTTGVCTCIDPNASFDLTSNSCQCNSGYFLNSGICTACTLPCAECSSSTTFCTACEDPTNMYLNTVAGTCRCWDLYANFNQTSKTCQCIQGYYMSSSGRCQPCVTPCAQCSNSATFCTECDDFANMNLNVTAGTCTCKDINYQFNPWVKICQSNPCCNCNQCDTTNK